MPRKAIPVDPVVIAARIRLRAYLRKEDLTPTEFSRMVGCDQATVQRLLAGRTKTLTPAVKKMLKYASIDENECIDSSTDNALQNTHIRQALARVWDGSDGSAQLLARLIVAIAPVITQSVPINYQETRQA